jgi:small subunit ribosomal protein S27e
MPGRFVKVKCEKCKNEQVVFDRAAGEVRCLVCGEVLAKPTGGLADISAKAEKAVQ